MITSIVDEITNHVSQSLEKSEFFTGLRNKIHTVDHLRQVFAQYYLWRNAFHRWFGVCIAKAPSFGTSFDTDYVLTELIEHIEEEIKGDHHGMCKTFLNGLGLTDVKDIHAIDITQKYIDSFQKEYMYDGGSFEESLAALAGRELVAPERNRIIIDCLSNLYNIKQGLGFFKLHEELEVEHFKGLWNAVTKDYKGNPEVLEKAAKKSITDHVQFWDDVSNYYYGN
ncbi:iron-containing redox enzyme family protein [Anoxybacteroides tepidamans]|uniref:iron-containing redox enzyme family protein n=1 Tax=Anoxybacteroides tepidamans TaxID=265948 RepID=UPI0004828958|nr:iron-containing redox enzyme family protein [Anoxybacillus tepidamans]